MKNRTKYKTMTVRALLDAIKQDGDKTLDIVVPEYQRESYATAKQATDMFVSLMEGDYIPPIVLAKTSKKHSMAVVDGLQRLSMLAKMGVNSNTSWICGGKQRFGGAKKGRDDRYALIEGHTYQTLINILNMEPTAENLAQYKNAAEIRKAFEKEDVESILEEKIPIHIIPAEKAKETFMRLNTTSKKLSQVEKTHGEAYEQELWKAAAKLAKDFADVGLVNAGRGFRSVDSTLRLIAIAENGTEANGSTYTDMVNNLLDAHKGDTKEQTAELVSRLKADKKFLEIVAPVCISGKGKLDEYTLRAIYMARKTASVCFSGNEDEIRDRLGRAIEVCKIKAPKVSSPTGGNVNRCKQYAEMLISELAS